jgi:glycine dehydrogenase subunit 2
MEVVDLVLDLLPVKDFLREYLPGPIVIKENEKYDWYQPKFSIGRMHGYHGNFLVALRALVYMKLLGKEGLDTLGAYAVPECQISQF